LSVEASSTTRISVTSLWLNREMTEPIFFSSLNAMAAASTRRSATTQHLFVGLAEFHTAVPARRGVLAERESLAADADVTAHACWGTERQRVRWGSAGAHRSGTHPREPAH